MGSSPTSETESSRGATAPGPVVWYVTPHGYGHAARSCAIVAELNRLWPAWPVILVSTHPESFLRARVPSPVTAIRADALDIGLVMRDSVTIDYPASLRALDRWIGERPARIEWEKSFLRQCGASLVVSDLPSIAFEAAAAAHLPSVGIANFSWSWIYEHYIPLDARWAEAARVCRAGYGQAGVLLKYPLDCPMDEFSRVEHAPLAARAGRARRAEMTRRYGLNTDATWGLLSFTSLDLSAAALDRMSAAPDIEWITVHPLAWPGRAHFTAVDRADISFSDVLATCDVVLTKPGHGILSECVANRKPVVHVERPDWPEHAPLVRGIERYLRHAPLAGWQLAEGRVEHAIRRALAAPEPPEPPPPVGADLIAHRLRNYV